MPEQHLTLSVRPRGLPAWLFGSSVVVGVKWCLVSLMPCGAGDGCGVVVGGVGDVVGSVCVDATRGEWRSTCDDRRAMRRATRGARWVDQERAYVGTTCKVEETTRGSPGGEPGEKEKDGNMQEERT